MKFLRSSGKPRKPKIVIRRVAGRSMEPALKPGQLVVGLSARYRTGDIVVFEHRGYEKVKRVIAVDEEGFKVSGDNLPASSDSRDFGAIPHSAAVAVIVWPRT